MPFLRTNSGISNSYLFHAGALIIFTEGGTESFSFEKVEQGQYNSSSIDIKFWNHIFESTNFNKKIKFKALGSKTSLNCICEKIINGEVANIAVVMDRDLDQYFDVLNVSPFILYTKGYSWENDVFTEELTTIQIANMSLEADLSEMVILLIKTAYKDFRIYGKHLLKLEIIFRKNGVKFISELKGERFFPHNKQPFIDREQVRNILTSKKDDITRPVKINIKTSGDCPLLSNYGKLLEALSLSIISYICKKYSSYSTVPKLMIETAMIERFAQKITAEKDEYYFKIVKQLEKNLS